ncbi:hypothetical protein B0H14DRAFT_3692840 [Mycena olivaceomarginata]|nr:hypothetical protein B0H14DRAFT_3692840 [Mycena olivaceomarginata]
MADPPIFPRALRVIELRNGPAGPTAVLGRRGPELEMCKTPLGTQHSNSPTIVPNAYQLLRSELPARLADLDSAGGRRNFIISSVKYLFGTTYEDNDDLPISTLVVYLNSAVPSNKHEDFDLKEVTDAAETLDKEFAVVFGVIKRVSEA